MFHVNKNHYFLWIIASTLITFGVVSYLSMASQIKWKEPVLKHSYTFEDGTAKDVVGEAHGTIKGNSEITHGLFITDEEGDYLEFPADKIKINEYSAITLEAYVIAGKGNGAFTMLSYFGNTRGEYGADYICQTLVNNLTSGTSISCKNYELPWETASDITEKLLSDDQFHHIVTTFDNHELKFYLDGKLVSELPSENKDNIIKNLSNKFAYLCKSGYLQDQTWLGAIETFNIYEGILNDKMIANSAKKLDTYKKNLEDYLTNNHEAQTTKPVLKHSYTFEDGTANDLINNANGMLVGNGMIGDGLFIADEEGEYVVLPANKININEYSSVTLEAFVLIPKGRWGQTISYFGSNRASRGINYINQCVDNNNLSYTGISCITTVRPWETRTELIGISIQDDKYHHVVTTFDNEILKYYVDGKLMGTQFNLRQKSNNISNLSNDQAYLFKSGNRWEETLKGAIDTFNIYEGVLDAETIAKSAEEYLKEKEL
ncbi:LamG-like jellyroll fold domain-containing protein [Tamlana flava]|uniref:LamG-like jellyroll fold domain-containing protein n=1 Tax=Tamlana flava TaxID=3158572 RepID=UPI00351B1B0B